MQVLNPQQTQRLLALLAGSEARNLQSLGSEFEQAFPAQERFQACCAGILLLQDNFLLKPWQRITLWFTLVSTYKTQPVAGNPFIAFLVQAGSDSSLPLVERAFLLNLLYASDLDQLASFSPRHYLDSFVAGAVPPLPERDVLEAKFLNGPALASASSASLSTWLHNLPDPEAAPKAHPSASVPDATTQFKLKHREAPCPSPDLLSNTPNGVTSIVSRWMEGFDLAWERPRPAPLTPALQELKWLGPITHQPLVWDACLCQNTSRALAVKELIGKALTGPLLPVQQQQVLTHLEVDPKLVHQLGLTPAQLPLLVEHTPVLAYALLRQLVHSRQGHEYLAVLAAMDMSLHSMEVVNRLTSATQLPMEFVHLYITNCISSCEGIQDKNMQNRLVRLLCVFLQNLIKKGAFNIRDLLHEVQAFCINFSRIREAVGLFRLLKQYEAGGRNGSAGGGNSNSNNAWGGNSNNDHSGLVSNSNMGEGQVTDPPDGQTAVLVGPRNNHHEVSVMKEDVGSALVN